MTAPAPPARQSRNHVLSSAVGQLLPRLESYVPTESKKGDRGKLARLRRGAGKSIGEVNEATMVFFGETPVDLYDDEADDLYTVATLFAWHPVNGDPVRDPPFRTAWGFGGSLAAIRNRDDGNEDEGVTRRFTALLNSRLEGVPTHLRQLIALLHSRAKDTPINYSQLFFDLRGWEAADRHVQRNWAAGFWCRGSSGAAPAPPTNDDDDDDDDDDTTTATDPED